MGRKDIEYDYLTNKRNLELWSTRILFFVALIEKKWVQCKEYERKEEQNKTKMMDWSLETWICSCFNRCSRMQSRSTSRYICIWVSEHKHLHDESLSSSYSIHSSTKHTYPYILPLHLKCTDSTLSTSSSKMANKACPSVTFLVSACIFVFLFPFLYSL